MAADSTLDPSDVQGTTTLVERKGNDTGSLGPSDSSDSGSDIGFDRIIGPADAGLGTGLDEAELARKGR